jgi:membrane-associated phospholipid phosphatase
MSGWEIGWGLEFLVFMNNLGGHALDVILEPLHWLGGELGYTLLLPLVLWSISDRMGRRLFLLAMFSVLVNGILKISLARPRPYQVDPQRIIPAHMESSYGLPSGHAQGGMVMGLYFIRESRRIWVKFLIIAGILLMGISRMIFGVHFLQDVLAGWLLGALVFVLFYYTEAPLISWITGIPAWISYLLALVPAMAALLTEALVPAIYPMTKSLLTSGAALSGILIAAALEGQNGYYRTEGETWKRLLRVPLGLALLLGIQIGLSALFYAAVNTGRPSLSLSVLYSLRYLIMGFSAYWLIPEIFIRLKLAGPRERVRS